MSKIIASKRMGKKKKLAIIVSVVIVVLAAGAAFLIFTPVGKNFTGWVSDRFSTTNGDSGGDKGGDKHSPDDPKYSAPGSEPDISDTRQAAYAALDAGDTAKAEAIYRDAVASAESVDAKVNEYLALSRLFMSEDYLNLDKALYYAFEAEKISPGPGVNAQIATVYFYMGNEEKMKEYDDRNSGEKVEGVGE